MCSIIPNKSPKQPQSCVKWAFKFEYDLDHDLKTSTMTSNIQPLLSAVLQTKKGGFNFNPFFWKIGSSNWIRFSNFLRQKNKISPTVEESHHHLRPNVLLSEKEPLQRIGVVTTAPQTIRSLTFGEHQIPGEVEILGLNSIWGGDSWQGQPLTLFFHGCDIRWSL